MKMRQVYAAAFAFMMVAGGIFVTINLTDNTESMGAVSGDYRSKTDGNWNSTGTWERFDGTNWVAATSTPTASNGTISIRDGDTVNVTANVSVDQVQVNTGGCLQVNTGTLTIANGSGTDLLVDGALNLTTNLSLGSSSSVIINGTETINSGTVSIGSSANQTIASGGRIVRKGGTFPTSTSSSLTVSSGGTFEHRMNSGVVPAATWSNGSTVEITGITTTMPTGLTQSFSNFTWNSTSQTGFLNLNATLTTINGNFSFESTGTGYVQLDQQGNNSITNVGGNFYFRGGTLYGCMNGSTTINVTGDYVQTGGTHAFSRSGGTAYGNSSTGMYVNNNVLISGGTLDMSQCDANNPVKGAGMLYAKKDVTISSPGTVTVTSAQSRGNIIFNGTTEQRYIADDVVIGKVDFYVNALAILRLDQQVVKSGGTFTIYATGGMIIGDANGINLSGASGNVQVTGTRTYSTGADFTYNGTTAQFSGDGLPLLCRNLTFNNTNNITMNTSSMVSGTISFLGGIVITNSNYVGMGSSALVLGALNRVSGYVVGNFRRWFANTTVSNVIFPVGRMSTYNPIQFAMTTAPTAGTITCSFVEGESRHEGFPLDDAGDVITQSSECYWTATAGNGFNGGVYLVNVYGTGLTGITDYTLLHLIRRPGIGTPWTAPGTHIAATGSNEAPVVNRSALTVLGHYSIGSSNVNPLPIELLYFTAKPSGNKVELLWSTAAEKDNDYFTVERSMDGRNFRTLLTQQGAGNSRVTLKYSDWDNEPIGTLIYYRLKQTDFDGKYSYSSIISVRMEKSNAKQALSIESVGPNPFKDNFRMQFYSEDAKEADLMMMNLSGQIVHQEKINCNQGINQYTFNDNSGLSPGTYILTILTADSKVTQKVIKN